MRLTKTQITALQAVERGAVWDEEHTEYFQLWRLDTGPGLRHGGGVNNQGRVLLP